LGEGEHVLGLLPPFLAAGPRGALVGGKLSPIPLYKDPLWMRVGHTWIEGVPFEELSSPPHVPPLSSFSLMWLPEGMCRSEVKSTTPRRRAAGILDPIQN
jgi:hypothetical protein